MLRKCHCNTCSVAVATQDPALRAKFPGKGRGTSPTTCAVVAEELRELMGALGFRTVEEMVGPRR